MSIWEVPWLECAVATAVAGSLSVSRMRQPIRTFRVGLAFTGATLACAVLAWLAYQSGMAATEEACSAQFTLFGRRVFALDPLSAPLVPLIAGLHFLTALATGRTIMRSFSLTWSLAALALRLAIFSCRETGPLVGLLAVETLPPLLELRNRGQSTRVYLLHMALFVGLMIIGWAHVDPSGNPEDQPALATLPMLVAILLRCGSVPFQCWVTDWFEHASFGNALLFVMPLVGIYAAVRLLVPIASDEILTTIRCFSLLTAVYAAGMALVQRQTRRFFAYVYLSQSALVLLGLALHTPLSVTAALALWFSVPLSLAGFGLTFRALEARFGQLSLAEFHGLYDNSPALAVCFMLTGLASVSFPGTLGFVAAELLVNGALEAGPSVGLSVVAAAALNGIAVVRAYFRLFTGKPHFSTVSLTIGPRERVAVLSLAALILGGGLFPQPGLLSRYQAAQELLQEQAPAALHGQGPAARTAAAGRAAMAPQQAR